jgi:hypothetical protein
MDLLKFCASSADPRTHMHQPMKVGIHAVATNGHILIRVPIGDRDLPEAAPNITLAIEKMDKGHVAGEPVDLCSLQLPPKTECPECSGAGHHYWVRCDECDGQGEFWHRNHKYNCLECHGEGRIKVSQHSEGAKLEICWRCDGDGEGFQVVRASHSAFQRRYLALLQTLPGLRLYPGPDAMAVASFTFDGGNGYLMPCRD